MTDIFDLLDDNGDDMNLSEIEVTEEVSAPTAVKTEALKVDIPQHIVNQAIEFLTNNSYSRIDAEYEVTKLIRSKIPQDKLFETIEKMIKPKANKRNFSNDTNAAPSSNDTGDTVDDIELKSSFYYTVFEPTGRNMKIDYPELGKEPEFKDLTNAEMVFVWWAGNRTSPVFNIGNGLSERQRVYVAYKKAFGKAKNDTLQQYLSGIFPAKIALALKKMNTYVPHLRLQAKLMAEKTWEDYRRIISTDISSFVDAEQKAKHISMVQKVRADMPNILRDIELGYGVSIKEVSDEVSNLKEIDLILQSEEQDYDL